MSPDFVFHANGRWIARSFGPGKAGYWESDDGVAWERIRLVRGARKARLGEGWFVVRARRLEYHPDGGTMRRLSSRPLGLWRHRCEDRGGGSSGMSVLGDAIIHIHHDRDGGAGCRGHWLMQFERFAR